jgi:hypothetical protein
MFVVTSPEISTSTDGFDLVLVGGDVFRKLLDAAEGYAGA